MNEKERKARRMFSNLRKYIGKRIVVKYWSYGKYIAREEILRSVINFDMIEIYSGGIPFAGYGVAIISIEDIYGKPLYVQPLYEPYDVRDTYEIIEVRRELFGDSLADKEIEKTKRNEELRAKWKKESQERIEKFKSTGAQELIEKTLPYIVESEQDSFKEMVANNSGSEYGITVVEMTSELLIAIGKGMDFEKAIKTIAEDKYCTSGYVLNIAASAISCCSPRGAEFRKYWDRLYGVSEENGVVNSPIL